jgi:hypothetical protein
VRRASRRIAPWIAAVALAAPVRLEAQTPAALAARCTAAGGVSAVCAATGVAAEALVGHLGLLAGLGSDVPGSASTLGRRVGSTPRIALALRAGVNGAALPDLGDASGLASSSFLAPSVRGSVTAGLFDGFRLMPTVGGFLSVDAFGAFGVALLPERRGFDGGVGALSVGARIGILREGFTLPGVSVSLARRFVGESALGDVASGDPARLVVDPSVTSVRVTVGKNLFAVDFLGGLGWDDHAARADFNVTDGLGGRASGNGSIDASRRLYFLGAATSFGLVFSAAVELGVARGFDPVPIYLGAFDPGGRTVFGGLALRLTI